MRLNLKNHTKIFVIVNKEGKLYVYKKGFDTVTFDNKIENRLIIKEDFYIYKTEKSVFDYYLTKNHRILYTKTYNNDAMERKSSKNCQEGYFAFVYILNKSTSIENSIKNIKEFDHVRYKVYKSFAFYDGELVANFYDYSIYKFEEACTALHWAKNISSWLKKSKIILDEKKEDIKFGIGIAHGSYYEYDELKGGRKSFAGVGLNKAARLGKLAADYGVCFCEDIYNSCKEMFNYLNLHVKPVKQKKLKGFDDAQQIFCI